MGNLFIGYLQSDPAFFFAVLITVVVSICLHELAHGFVALRLGDDTPRATGHMTLNPVVHMGVTSMVLLAVAGIAFGAMPVNWTRLRGKYAEAWVALAGPATNLGLAVLALTALAVWERFGLETGDLSPAVINGKYLLMIFGMTNVSLTLFNLIPIPPLDGSYVLANLVPSYRKLLSQDIVRGAMGAIFFAMFLGAGTFIQTFAFERSMKYLTSVSGKSPLNFYAVYERTSVQRLISRYMPHSDAVTTEDGGPSK